MAQYFVPGPAHVFVGVGPSKGLVHLGTTEQTPNVNDDIRYEPVFNDIAGSQVPMDMSYMGMMGSFDGVFNRYDELAYQRLLAMPNPFASNATAGFEPFGSIGTLMLTEDVVYPLIFISQYASKPQYSAMQPGRRYTKAILHPSSFQPGTRHKKVHLSWICLKEYYYQTGDFRLYDFNFSLSSLQSLIR